MMPLLESLLAGFGRYGGEGAPRPALLPPVPAWDAAAWARHNAASAGGGGAAGSGLICAAPKRSGLASDLTPTSVVASEQEWQTGLLRLLPIRGEVDRDGCEV